MALARPKTSPSISLACRRSSNRLAPRQLPFLGFVLIRGGLYQFSCGRPEFAFRGLHSYNLTRCKKWVQLVHYVSANRRF